MQDFAPLQTTPPRLFAVEYELNSPYVSLRKLDYEKYDYLNPREVYTIPGYPPIVPGMLGGLDRRYFKGIPAFHPPSGNLSGVP